MARHSLNYLISFITLRGEIAKLCNNDNIYDIAFSRVFVKRSIILIVVSFKKKKI